MNAAAESLRNGPRPARFCSEVLHALAPGSGRCDPETRIGLFAVFGQTRTEALPFVSDRTHRTSTDSRSEVTKDLVLFTQEDGLLAARGPNLFSYVNSNPLRYRDPTGLVAWDFTVTPVLDPAIILGLGYTEASSGFVTWDCRCDGSVWKLRFTAHRSYRAHYSPGYLAHEMKHVNQSIAVTKKFASRLEPYEAFPYSSESVCQFVGRTVERDLKGQSMDFDWAEGQPAIDWYIFYYFHPQNW